MRFVICTRKKIKDKNLLYLGHWAVEKKNLYNKKIKKRIISYHWNNRKKLTRDYIYLEKFSETVLKKLSCILNKVQNKKYSNRYWKFLLYPWLLSYNSILFDRWESINKVNSKKYKLIFETPGKDEILIRDYLDLIRLSQNNYWNENLYLKIAKFKKLNFLLKKNSENYRNSSIKTYNSIIKKILFNIIKKFFIYINFLKKNDKTLILNSQYSFLNYLSYFKINKTDYGFNFLERINNFFLDAFYEEKKRKIFKQTISYNKKHKNKFEKFYWNQIKNDIPEIFLEYFNFLSSNSIKRKSYHKVVTSFSHFNSLSDKFYIADQIEKNKKLYILEHGGALPALKELFYFEESVSDKKLTFYKPILKKQKKIPLNPYYLKYKNFSQDLGKKCCIFCGETPMWNYRVQYYATSSQSFNTLNNISVLVDNLNNKIKKNNILIKCKDFQNGFNFKDFYKSKYGKDSIYKNKNVKDFISESKFLILTYPETTIIEAVLSKKPFILLYSEKFYERHNITRRVIREMKKNKIIFTNPKNAAKHINKYWNDPNLWFKSKHVQNCISLLKSNYFPQKKLENKISL